MVDVLDADAPPEGMDALWTSVPGATLFLQPRWTETLSRAFPGLRSRYLIAREGNRLTGVLPYTLKRKLGLDQVLSSPFGTHGGPLTADGPTASRLAEAFHKRATRPTVVRCELTVFDPSSELTEALRPSLGTWFQEFQTHVIDLTPGHEELWLHRYRRNTRNCVRMAERAGLLYTVERDEAALAFLARTHAEQAEAWTGIPPVPLEALRVVMDAYGNDARILVGRREGEPVCAILMLEQSGRETHAWVSGAVPEARPLRAYHGLIDATIKDACSRGVAAYHFGGSGRKEKLEFFKETFAAKPVPVLRCFHMAGWFRRLRRGPAWD